MRSSHTYINYAYGILNFHYNLLSVIMSVIEFSVLSLSSVNSLLYVDVIDSSVDRLYVDSIIDYGVDI
jgi:hypothetical protein